MPQSKPPTKLATCKSGPLVLSTSLAAELSHLRGPISPWASRTFSLLHVSDPFTHFLIVGTNTPRRLNTHQDLRALGIFVLCRLYHLQLATWGTRLWSMDLKGKLVRNLSSGLTPARANMPFLNSCSFLAHVSKCCPLPVRSSLNLFCHLRSFQSWVYCLLPILCLTHLTTEMLLMQSISSGPAGLCSTGN